MKRDFTPPVWLLPTSLRNNNSLGGGVVVVVVVLHACFCQGAKSRGFAMKG